MAASTLGQAEIVKLLLDWEADVNAKGNKGETALAQSSYAGWPQVVKLLLEGKADVNAETKNGATPLMLASLKADITAHFDAKIENKPKSPFDTVPIRSS